MRARDTRLLRACRTGDVEMARAAIKAGADVNVRTGKLGGTPLFVAVDGNETDIVELLIAAGADVNARASNGMPVLILACTHDERGGALQLIRSGANPNARWAEHSDESPLHLAHHPAMVRGLVEAGADVNARDARGWTPFMHVVLASEWESARILIAAGADTAMRENRGRTAADLVNELELMPICPPPDIVAVLGATGRAL